MQACAAKFVLDSSPAELSGPRIAILLATYNGERYLAKQLDSLLAQSHHNWELHVSDDGSSDATLSIIDEYRSYLGERLKTRPGPKQGFAANFLSLALTHIDADYYAFCDQDDLWHPDKLERAVTWLEDQATDRPALYCSRTRLIDVNGTPIGLSHLFDKPPSFRNALVQSIAGGNTMVFNRALKTLLEKAGSLPVISHDWWLYMLTTGCHGTIRYDHIPSTDYRQHAANIIGANTSLFARSKRLGNVMSGQYLRWNEVNLSALDQCKELLCDDSRITMERFAKARQSSLIPRVYGVLRSGVYRQRRLENMALIAAAALSKV